MQAERIPIDFVAETKEEKRHFNIVVAGEFNSGKSSVLNLLLQKDVMPVSVGASRFPPASILPAEVENYTLTAARSGQALTKNHLFGADDAPDFGSINIEIPADEFRGAAIFEVSAEEDGSLSAQAADVLNTADLLIWCTMGQRAWCLSEISIVELLPKHLLETAILAVTRSDYLRNSDDIGKVEQRLEREAGRFFKSILMLDCSRKSIAAAADKPVWKKSGGEKLFDLVGAEFGKSRFKDNAPAKPKRSLLKAIPAQSVLPERGISLDEICAAWASEMDEIEIWTKDQTSLNEEKFARHIQQRFQKFVAAILPMANRSTATHDRVLAFKQAEIFLGKAMSTSGHPDIAVLAADLSAQLLRELNSSIYK